MPNIKKGQVFYIQLLLLLLLSCQNPEAKKQTCGTSLDETDILLNIDAEHEGRFERDNQNNRIQYRISNKDKETIVLTRFIADGISRDTILNEEPSKINNKINQNLSLFNYLLENRIVRIKRCESDLSLIVLEDCFLIKFWKKNDFYEQRLFNYSNNIEIDKLDSLMFRINNTIPDFENFLSTLSCNNYWAPI